MTMTVLRVIPHKSVKNNETRRLYSALHDLFAPNPSKNPLDKVKRLYAPPAESVSLWWIIRLSASEEGEGEQKTTTRKIEFFTAMPDAYVDAYKTKFRGHENWKSCTLEAVEDFQYVKDVDLYKLRYKRHDMFSLEYSYDEQETPIRQLMGVIHEMKAGEQVDIFIRLEAVDRIKWKKQADYAWQEWKKGNMLHRTGLDPARALKSLYELGETLFGTAQNLGTDVLGSVKRQFFRPDGDDFQHKERPKKSNAERDELLVNGDLSPRTKQKRNLPVFKTAIRMTVASADPVRREMLARSVAAAYEHADKTLRWKDNVLHATKVTMNKKRELEALQRFEIKELDPCLMSTDEVGKLCQLPTPALQEDFKDCLQANQRTEIEIPKLILSDKGILVGTATDRGKTHNVHIPASNNDFLFAPRVPCGSPRMGKDQFIINLIVEAKRKHGIGAVIPDFIDEQGRTKDGKHWRGMANAVRDALPPEDVIDINLADSTFSFYFGLEACFKNAPDLRLTADVIAEYVADFLLSESDEDKEQTKAYLMSAAKCTMGDLTGIKQMFTSEEYRQKMREKWDDVFEMDLWDDYEAMGEKKQAQIYGPVRKRLSKILDSEILKTMFSPQEGGRIRSDLYDWVKQGKVVILRVKVPEPLIMPERIKQMLAHWIMMTVFLINLSLGGKGAGCFLVLNEPHQFISDGMIHFLERTLSEGPKYRFAPIISFHFFSQFRKHPGFIDLLLASNVNWHLFKNTNIKVYESLMHVLEKTFESPQQAFDSTKAFQYIACWTNAGEYYPPFVCDALPMVNERYKEQDNSSLTKEHIRKYGRPTKEVLAEIKRRNRMSFAGASKS